MSSEIETEKSPIIKLTKGRYSYQDCWNYAFSLGQNLVVEEVKKVMLALCQTTPEKFWYHFSTPFLSSSRYSKICCNLEKYFQWNFPLPYLIHQVYFAGLPFCIEKGVFIPQPDTEILFQKTCQLINQNWKNSVGLKILDIGTGCGSLAINLAKVYPSSQVTALDISPRALKVVRRNIFLHSVQNVIVKHSNLFSQLEPSEKFNVIVANPPYIGRQEYNSLSLITKKQPYQALVAKQKGYFFYQVILSQASAFITSPFLLLFEIGYQQKKKILKLIIRYFPDAQVSVFADERGRSRVISIESLPKTL
ncbi:MAG: peptide chain release factor N(5)-glutamine methyltransferase [Candidatus Moeniiplasma glomeromycotorum]|nr:peptide chain release factor N(5)-glutamine methyltransferase [Candidatus Moeniiplasma glomeromycotorum]MCE8162463.1 peptide chain release factor N(5)-glutamine methyltransferase [Candidatus Moeniiplasma glomeromycotorum]MCE8166389.1 peptide chain release factor N(5)-glutamine methyltransferase [Candidatus Moeniiplasma glomeromycotorum]MCE8166871.1 peptide chain release factor N(5)-glutamine methyltransferase [Candidatus Moeniiplasma glomeromycotorum]